MVRNVRPKARVVRKSKPKDFSLGVCAGGLCMWLLGTYVAYNFWTLIISLVVSWLVDLLASGSISREDVYIE